MKIPKYLYGNPIEEWGSQWKDRLLPSARSKVLQKWNASGKKPKSESSNEYTKRRVKEETKRTWRSDAADIAHGIGEGFLEGVLALHPYTAIPYYGAKVGQDVINGNVGWKTAVNASIPLFHLSPQIKIPVKSSKNIIDLQAKVSDLLNNDMYITEDIINGTKEGFKDSYKYYSSDKYIEHLKSSGLSEKEAKELLNLKLNNLLDIRINWDHSDPAAYGHSITTTEGGINTELNPKVANTYDLARETMWHESGGHGTLRNFEQKHIPIILSSEKLRNIYSNPWYRKVSEHNSELIPELKPVWKAFMKGDIKQFNKLATKEDLDIINKYKDPKSFIDYLVNEQEASARAISANIGDFVGKSTKWNLPQLEQFFTKDGIKKLRENVWLAGSLFGGGIAFGNYDYNPEYKKQGGKMNTLLFLKNGSGIHIKKKNRGKFTDYCGGKVTDECIRRAKASGNPTLVKRATFALNARRWKHKEGGKAFVEGVNVLDSNPNAYKYVKKKYKMHLQGGNLIINYIKAIENPNRIGWNGKVWQAPNLKGYDINLRGYGIDINTNQSAKKLTNGRPGRWITDAEASKLMNEHINYITTAANKHIKGFNKLSPQRQAALLGMLYRGDSVNKSGINYLTKDDKKFFTSIGNYYRSKGLNERANNSDKFFKRYLQLGGNIDWNSIANVGLNLLLSVSKNKQISEEAEAAKAMNKLTSKDFFDIYNLKLQEAKLLEEQLAKAVEAMTGTTINSSNIVAANNAWKNASGEYTALKNNVDLQNRAIDAQAQALKSNIWGNAISGVMLQGVGLLGNYLNNKKSSNITTGITTPSITTPSYNYFSTPKKFGTFNNDGSMNLGYNMTWSTDKGVQTKKWSDNISIFNKSLTDYLK